MSGENDADREMVDLIQEYFSVRRLQWPSTEQAILWTITELGEACELLLALKGGWVRNDPGSKERYSRERFEEELADAIMMLMVAGMSHNSNPLAALRRKMQKWLDKEQ